MWRTLAYKEFRECLGFAAIGLAIYVLVAGGAMRMDVAPIPGVTIIPVAGGSIPFLDNFSFHYAIATIVLATALGIRQSWPESNNSCYLFLFHRPISRKKITNAKLIVGLALLLLCSAVPILLLGWWAKTPGTHASPFFWSMTLNTWIVWATMPLVYLGAFLSGLLPARWVGTRLAPLAASILFAYLLSIAVWAPIRLLFVVVIAAWLYVSIHQIATTRDYS